MLMQNTLNFEEGVERQRNVDLIDGTAEPLGQSSWWNHIDRDEITKVLTEVVRYYHGFR